MRRRTIPVTGLLVLALTLVSACARSADAAPGHGGTTDLATAIVGTWRPVEIPGYTPPGQYPNALRDAPITFDAQHTLQGTDGCNGFRIDYRVTSEGRLRVGEGVQTEIGCANVPNVEVVSSADRVQISGGSLTFTDAKGKVLGRYTRSGATN
jgi:heat shock protein HslJ